MFILLLSFASFADFIRYSVDFSPKKPRRSSDVNTGAATELFDSVLGGYLILVSVVVCYACKTPRDLCTPNRSIQSYSF